jgi:hypothetical protein
MSPKTTPSAASVSAAREEDVEDDNDAVRL